MKCIESSILVNLLVQDFKLIEVKEYDEERKKFATCT